MQYIHIYKCTHIYTHKVCLCMNKYAFIHVHTPTYIYMYTQKCLSTRLHIVLYGHFLTKRKRGASQRLPWDRGGVMVSERTDWSVAEQ